MKNSVTFSDNVLGIRPAASLIKRYRLKGKMNVILNDDQVIIKPVKPVHKAKDLKIQLHQDTEEEVFLNDEALEDTESEYFY